MKCPKCGRDCDRLLALSRRDNKTNICDECGVKEALEDFKNYHQSNKGKTNPYERTRQRVYGSGNKWAIENFEATHS